MKISLKDRKVIALIGVGILLIASVLINLDLFLPKKDLNKLKETPIKTPTPKENIIKIERDESKQIIIHYDAENLRDPFAPLVIKRLANLTPSTPLEMYDIEELKLVGIITDYKKLALFKTPDGKFHIAKEKDKIGNSGWIITKIHINTLEIKEPPASGGYLPRTKQIKLKPEDRG